MIRPKQTTGDRQVETGGRAPFFSSTLLLVLPSSRPPFFSSSLHLVLPSSRPPLFSSSLHLVLPSSRPPFFSSSLHLVLPSSRPPFFSSSPLLVLPSSRPPFFSSSLLLVLPSSRPPFFSSSLLLVLPSSRPPFFSSSLLLVLPSSRRRLPPVFRASGLRAAPPELAQRTRTTPHSHRWPSCPRGAAAAAACARDLDQTKVCSRGSSCPTASEAPLPALQSGLHASSQPACTDRRCYAAVLDWQQGRPFN
jgi:hypothetical protein